MAADGMDKKGQNSPDSASEELFNLSRSPEDGTGGDRKDANEVDPPATSGSGPQEIVDLPNIHFGSKVGGMEPSKERQTGAARQKADSDPPRPADRQGTETAATAMGRLPLR